MEQKSTANYAFALKHYKQYGRGRSMRKFCEDEGYDYDKFMRYSRKGQTEFSVLKEADDNEQKSKDPGFIPVVLDGAPASGLGVSEIKVRFSNGMELSQSDGDINELVSMIRKMLS